MTTEKRNDEIDLIEVFQKMGNGIVNLCNKLIHLLYQILLFFIRRAILIGVIVLIGLAIGFFRFKSTPRYYSSSLEAYSNAMSSLDMISYVNNINELFAEGNFTGLEEKLRMDSVKLTEVKNVKAYKVIDLNKDGITDLVDYDEKYQTSDTTISKSRFVVKVEVFDQSVFPVIQESILKYIEDNKYIHDLNAIRKKQLNELIAKLDSEISTLDSLKKTEYFKKADDQLKTQAGQLLVMNEKTTQLYHPQIISLYKEKQGLEQQLELRTDPITIIQDFSALSVVENNLMHYLKIFGIIGIVLGILIGILVENLKGIRKLISDSKKK
jgi:hypothetical protein